MLQLLNMTDLITILISTGLPILIIAVFARIVQGLLNNYKLQSFFSLIIAFAFEIIMIKIILNFSSGIFLIYIAFALIVGFIQLFMNESSQGFSIKKRASEESQYLRIIGIQVLATFLFVLIIFLYT